MGEIGNLWVTIGARTTDLQRGLSQAKTGLQQTGKEAMTLKTAMDKLAMPIAGIATGIGALASGFKATVGNMMDYAKQVRDLQRDIGGSAEEISGLIQAADDVNISFGTLQAAMRAAVRMGVKPTIENIAVLSEEYNRLAPGVERTEYLMKRFGRSGAEMGALMELGADGIRNAAKEAEAYGLILDDVTTKQARELEKGFDNLGDALQGVGIKLGTALLPVITDATNAIVLLTTQGSKQKALFKEHQTVIEKQAWTWSEWADELMRSANAAGQLGNGEYELYQRMREFGEFDPDMVREWGDAFGYVSEEAWNLKLAGLDPVINSGDALKDELNAGKSASDGYATTLGNLVSAMDAVNGKHMKTFLDVEVTWQGIFGEVQSMMSDPRDWYQDPRLYKQQQGLYGKGAKFKNMEDDFNPDNPGGASGLSMIVPAGYPNDSFNIKATSGEKVTIEPLGGGGKSGGEGVKIYGAAAEYTMRTLLGMSDTEIAGFEKVAGLNADLANGDISAWDYAAAMQAVYTVLADIKGLGRIPIPLATGGNQYKQKGGAQEGYGGASGLSMIVPAGYPNDSFNVKATSGEKVTIEPLGGGGKSGGGGDIKIYAPVTIVAPPGAKSARELFASLRETAGA